jgi:hypothetical protein
MDSNNVIADTRRWLTSVVIGLNLCPFARRVFEADTIRYAVTDAPDEQRLLAVLACELRGLASCADASIETTLLIHPLALGNFLDYNDFLSRAERLNTHLGFEGTIQIVSFHPAYQFAGSAPDAVENYTNRSPYPMLHLLREESISQLAMEPAALLAIPNRNSATLRRLGIHKVLERLRGN